MGKWCKRLLKLVVGIFILICVVDLVGKVNSHIQSEKRMKEAVSTFKAEREAVVLLYDTLKDTIKNPDEEHYNNALSVATNTEEVCFEAYQTVSSLGVTHFFTSAYYYITFYRDVMLAIERNCSIEDLEYICELLEDAIKLYDYYDKQVESDASWAIHNFYEQIISGNDKFKIYEKLEILY